MILPGARASITPNARLSPGLDIESMLALRLLRLPYYAIPLYTNPLYWHQQNGFPFADTSTPIHDPD